MSLISKYGKWENSKKQKEKICEKKANYKKGEHYYCNTHVKNNKTYIIPSKTTKTTYLKKQKIQTLIDICHKHLIYFTEKKKKEEIIQVLEEFYAKHCLDVLNTSKKESANEIDLIDVGRNMKTMLNQIPKIQEVTHVLIENQISPIANRMKTIQGMLSQYFIMLNDKIEIIFVSSSHKLNQFNREHTKKTQVIKNTNQVSKYKEKVG